MCIHGFVKFMQNLCSDLKVLRRIQGGLRVGDDGRGTILLLEEKFATAPRFQKPRKWRKPHEPPQSAQNRSRS